MNQLMVIGILALARRENGMMWLLNKEYSQSQNSHLYTERYEPKRMSELAVNKHKIKEFETFMNHPDKKLLIIQGPPGCAKNTLVKTYCRENNLEFKQYKEAKMLQACETMGYYNDRPDKKSDDFESMMNFINQNIRLPPKGNSNDDK
jgi:hypothetical protein